ncbi:MAG TPA: DUF4153 domain-containing protein [Puia sp.]|nr:DUF4153 domain-containing protein [Puia sp.]
MKLPSLTSLLNRTVRSFLRFPLAILLAIAGTVISIYLVNSDRRYSDTLLVRCGNAIISCYLGMLLSIAVTVWSERRAWGRKASAGGQLVVMAMVVLYYFFLPDHFETKTAIRCTLYALGLHWLIAVIAFAGSYRIEAFWQYNKDLFIRILTSLLYTVVLYAGLALALEAIEHLFNVDLSYKWYADTWCVLIGIFNSWFFLSGFPSDDGDIITVDYPKGLKIFTQYVLLPILTVYMGILYVYLFKIIFTAHWPSGWVAYLVLGFSVAGILALLLIYPLRNDENNKWINSYSRFFYFALLPLLVMLGFAISKRIRAYGITELRYFVLLLALWLLLMAMYFLFSRKKNIVLIPLTLCFFAFASSFGPWGVFNVSRYSQQHRLQGLLEKNGFFKDGKVISSKSKLSTEDRREISSTTEYIVGTHGYESLQPWFRENLDSLMRKDSLMGKYEERERAEAILKLMHISYASRYYDDVAGETSFAIMPENDDQVLPTDGLPYMIPAFYLAVGNGQESVTERYQVGKYSVALFLDSSLNQVRMAFAEGAQAEVKDGACVVELKPLLKAPAEGVQYNTTLPVEKRTLPIHCAGWDGKLIVTSMNGTRRDSVLHVAYLRGYLFLGQTGK